MLLYKLSHDHKLSSTILVSTCQEVYSTKGSKNDQRARAPSLGRKTALFGCFSLEMPDRYYTKLAFLIVSYIVLYCHLFDKSYVSTKAFNEILLKV